MAYQLIFPVLDQLDAERAHGLAIRALELGIVPGDRQPDPAVLRQTAFGLTFANPIGLAAGFDKNGEVVTPMLGLCFCFVEVGSLTPFPPPRNPKPRVFRPTPDRAVIH